MDILMQFLANVPALFELLAAIEGKIHVGLAAVGAGVGVGGAGVVVGAQLLPVQQ